MRPPVYLLVLCADQRLKVVQVSESHGFVEIGEAPAVLGCLPRDPCLHTQAAMTLLLHWVLS